MRSGKEIRLRLEILEDRLALSGAFGGAINAGVPSLTPFPFNGLTAQVTNAAQSQPAFRNTFNYDLLTFTPAPSMQSQLQSFQSQLQAFQTAQTAMIDQFFSQVGAVLQQLRINTLVVV